MITRNDTVVVGARVGMAASWLLLLCSMPLVVSAFVVTSTTTTTSRQELLVIHHDHYPLFREGQPLFSSWNDNHDNNNSSDNDDDADLNDDNQWIVNPNAGSSVNGGEDWQELMARQKDGSFWASFEPSPTTLNNDKNVDNEVDDTEAWLDTLASISAEELQFNNNEADRADKVRQMQEWGFDSQSIANTLGVATDPSLEGDDVEGMQAYRKAWGLDDQIDLTTAESHAQVECDPDTGEPVRSQMVYVDEHACIGCTHCAMTAQSTFFMQEEHGRARVFRQWGDDDETIQTAIETCPVDCIHYVPYDELVQLEVERRHQKINFKARLVSQGEGGGAAALSHRVGGGGFTAPQRISGNMKLRCNNCPTRGCPNCPMYGVGQNPEYQRMEQQRKERIAKRRMEEQRERDVKRVDL